MNSEPPRPSDRRDFNLKLWTGVLSGLLGAIPATIGSLFFLDPLLRKNGQSSSGDGFVKLPITIQNLPPDGTPQLVTVKADKVDAWNNFPDQAIGSIWLRKDNEGKVRAFTTVCPHLGCRVDYRSGSQDFYCPCHASTFDLEGKQLNSIPPRPMDDLAVEERDGSLWIRYENFRGGVKEKTPV